MDAEALFLGVDGGGSKTRALLADQRGHILGVGEAGPSNPFLVGQEGSVTALVRAVEAARRAAGQIVDGAVVAGACVGLAGLDASADGSPIARALIERGWAARVSVVTDCELLLAAGLPDPHGPGLALIAGTGSICWGRASDGRIGRAGGWGHLIGDEGSGYALSVAALRLCAQTADGRADAHELATTLQKHLGVGTRGELVRWVYNPGRTSAELASASPLVFEAAAQGNVDAQRLVSDAASALGHCVQTVSRTLDLAGAPLVVGGSLLVNQALLRSAVAARLGLTLADLRVVDEPARGALIMARRV